MRIKISAAIVVLLSLGALGYFFLIRQTSEQKEDNARKKLAFESLLQRLPRGKAIPPTKAPDSKSIERWQELDQSMAFSNGIRASLLKGLHEKTTRFFIESPGQGSSRLKVTSEQILLDDYGEPNGVNQPGEAAHFPLSPGEPLSRVEPNDELFGHHKDRLWEFLYPTGFGYVKDRAHVAGFKSHGFRSLREPRDDNWQWRVQNVQLIGILSHTEPVVYLGDKLPSMEQVRLGKTRPLDVFEEMGLPALCEREDLFIASRDTTLRMLGAIRAVKTCQQCHDAEVGDLLGAFSYTLRREPAADNGQRR